MASAPTANDLTRQQLDELDALLQRMLSLPLNPPEAAAAPPSTLAFAPPLPATLPMPFARETLPPASFPISTPTPAPMPAIAPRLLAAPVPSEPEEEPFPWTPSSPPVVMVERFERVVPAAPDLPFAELTLPAAPVAFADPLDEPMPAEPVPFLYVPLVAFNALLNWGLGLLGLPGRVLRSGFVKTLFGLAGLGLLVYTALKVAQTQGWVSLPVLLPWPR